MTLSRAFESRDSAQTAYWDVIAYLRKDMTRERRTRSAIEPRVAAVRVGYGVAVGAWGDFEPREPKS